MKNLKTNVSIKFTTIEEYREIERTLVSMGYKIDALWNTTQLIRFENTCKPYYLFIDLSFTCAVYSFPPSEIKYNSLQEFLT